jgi:hypothetical protein
MIVFKNKGLIDVRAISTMGVSVKKEGSIGYFGTGLKYAIAVLLREGQQITIWRGKDAFKFTSKPEEIRGETFSIVYMNEKEMGFTTDLGKNWDLWQAYREIYCNCKDEGGYYKEAKSIRTGTKASTAIAVKGQKFEEIHINRSQYIIEEDPDLKLLKANVHDEPCNSIYYKGVNIFDGQANSICRWNITSKIDLTEDRTAKYTFQLRDRISESIVGSNNKEFIERCVLAPDKTFEGELDYDVSIKPSEEFMEVCGSIIKTFKRGANRSAIKYAKKYGDFKDPVEVIELNTVQTAMMQRAVDLLMKAKFDTSGYSIVCVKTMGNSISGVAKNNTIYITEAAFEIGTKELALTLLEEYWHLEKGFEDNSREFQNFLFAQIGTLIETVNGEPF